MPGPVWLIFRCLQQAHLVLLITLCLCVACSRSQPGAGEAGRRNFTDGLGRVVAVAPNPQRIISLAPNITETLFALGLGHRVVGVTTYCDFPAEARAKEKVGDTIHPDLERIIALKPDLVVVSTASQLENLTRRRRRPPTRNSRVRRWWRVRPK